MRNSVFSIQKQASLLSEGDEHNYYLYDKTSKLMRLLKSDILVYAVSTMQLFVNTKELNYYLVLTFKLI